MLFAAAREAGIGTSATCQLHRAMSALRGNPEDICSDRVLPTYTLPHRHTGGQTPLSRLRRSGPGSSSFKIGELFDLW
jgi:hypothetical protein